MSAFNVQIDEESRRKVEESLKAIPNGVPIVITRAINKTAAPVVSILVKDAAKQTGFPQKAIRKKNIRLTRANYRNLSAEIKVRGFGIPVIQMKARQTRKGVTYKDGTGRKLIPGAFIAKMASGHEGVYLRATTGTRRELRYKSKVGKALRIFGKSDTYLTELPIKEQKTAGVPDLVVNSGAYELAKAEAQNRLPAEVANQINVLLEQHARKSQSK